MITVCLLTAFLALAHSAFAQDFTLTGAVDWTTMTLNADVSLDMASADLSLPGGRVRGEELLRLSGPSLLESRLFAITVDSAGTIGDRITAGELTYADTNAMIAAAKVSPPVLSDDLSAMRSGYGVSLEALSAALIRHTRPGEIRRNLDGTSAAAYTGIIIIATGALPVHGMKTAAFTIPCLFPKIRDTAMNLLYEKNMLDPALAKTQPMVRYAAERDIFLPTPSGLSESLAKLVGERPLKIFARAVYGEHCTDPIIDAEDALLITSGDAMRSLLRQGKVVIVLSDAALRQEF